MTEPNPSVPALGGRDAAFVMRILSIARSHELPLASSMTAAADVDGLPQAKRFARHVEGMDDADFLDALAAALSRSGQWTGAEVLETLRPIGLPADGLRRLADWFTDRAAARHRMFTAISYPFTLTIVAAVVYGVFMHLFLMPWIVRSFQDLFDGLGATLAPLTAAIVWFYKTINGWMSQPVSAVLYIAIVILFASLLVRFALRFPEWKISLVVPLARRFLYQEAGASFCRTLALLLENGISAPEAIRLAARVPANRRLGNRLARMADEVEAGANMGECLRDQKALLPSIRWRLWSAYYRSELVSELRAVAEQELEQLSATELRIVNASKAIVSIVAMVTFFPIGVVVIAFYLPMFTLVSQIG
jgi:type II secretory pathway component PulF